MLSAPRAVLRRNDVHVSSTSVNEKLGACGDGEVSGMWSRIYFRTCSSCTASNIALRGSDEMRAMCSAMLLSACVALLGGRPFMSANDAAAMRVFGFVRLYLFHSMLCFCFS